MRLPPGASSGDQRIGLLRTMLLIRSFEETAIDLTRRGVTPADMHDSIGQEAVAVGVCAALRPGDYLASTHRCHGHCIARGMDPRYMLAELAGRQQGYCKAKGGSVNLADRSLNMLGGNNIVGASVGLAAGAALASTFRGGGDVAVAMTTEGATSTGIFHETLNLASLWTLPVVFVVENNQYSISTPIRMQVAGGNIAARAAGYGMPGAAVDGNDPEAVLAVMETAVDRARSGGGPSLVEARTYRIAPHWSGDWGGYRDDAEVDAARQRDPIKTLSERLLREGAITREVLDQLRNDAAATMTKAAEFAQGSPLADPAEMVTDVYGTKWVGNAVAHVH